MVLSKLWYKAYIDIITKMNLSDNSLLLRQPATLQEMEHDRQSERFISPVSRTTAWTRSESDGFFACLQTKMEKCENLLNKV